MNMPIVYLYNLETEKGGKIKTLCLLLKIRVRPVNTRRRRNSFPFGEERFGIGAGSWAGGSARPVSYTHLDVYKRQIIFLTAKNDLDSKINGLKMGAEAYVEKPF